MSKKKLMPKKKVATKSSNKNVSSAKTTSKKRTTKTAVEKKDKKRKGDENPLQEIQNFPSPHALLNETISNRFDELLTSRLQAEAVLKKYTNQIFSNPQVTGAHVGFRRVNGSVGQDPQYCIRIHVAHKWKPADHPRILSSLPSEFDGVPVDVMQQNYFNLAGDGGIINATQLSGDSTIPSDRASILIGGLAIANTAVPGNWGTLGFPMYRNGKQVFITCQHVVGADTSSVRTVAQPPASAAQEDVIGSIVKSDQSVDAVAIEYASSRKIRHQVVGRKGTFYISQISNVDDNQAFKVGAASGSTKGRIKSVSASVRVDGRTLSNQILIEPIDNVPLIKPGDSGSVLLQEVRRDPSDDLDFRIVGLIHAGSDEGMIVAMHIGELVTQLGITDVPPTNS